MAGKPGFWTLTFLVIANMIGAGLFTTSGFSLSDLGSPHLVVMAWVVGGLIAVTGALSYGMLVNAMPESGGEYLFLSRAAHPLLGFIAGWVSLIAGFSGAIAFAATAFEGYILPLIAKPVWLPAGGLSILAIVVAGGLHGLRPRAGAMLQNSIVVLKLILLVVILLFALSRYRTYQWQGLQAADQALTGWKLIYAFAGSLVWISLSYAGFNAAVYIAGEVESARQLVPRSLMTGTLIVTALYVLLNAVFVYSTAHEKIKGAPDVAAVAARSLGGSGFELFVRVTIAICLFTSVLSMMMAAPRVYAKMAEDGLLPGLLKLRGGSPISATLAQVLIASILVTISTLQDILSYLGLTLSISSVCSVACLFLPSVRRWPLFHVRHLAPAIYILSTTVAAVLMVTMNPWQLIGTAITFAVGAVIYGMTRFGRRRTRSLNDCFDRVHPERNTGTERGPHIETNGG